MKHAPTDKHSTQPSLSQHLFEAVRLSRPSEKNIAKLLATVLNLSESAVYKKLKGENVLTLEEAATLAQFFQISLDNFLLPTNAAVPMAFYPLSGQVSSPTSFLERLLNNVEMANQLTDAHLHYATTEIPIFHYLHFPELTAFKLFVWGRTTWELDEQHVETLPEDLAIDPAINHLRERILEGYHRLNSTEFWSLHLLENTLSQIQYFAEENIFRDHSFPVLLLEQISQLLGLQKSMAKNAVKHHIGKPPSKNAGAFLLFHNEIAHTNNTFLLTSREGSSVFSTFDNPNFLQTSEPAFVEYTKKWFGKLQKRSTSLTHGAERQRVRFFSKLEQRMKQG
ncbi:MAG: hypothetical protein KF734_01120 [Saprospiraceae bacterium]|nr:hypothetical protein [Saprospiraceae bacterium]